MILNYYTVQRKEPRKKIIIPYNFYAHTIQFHKCSIALQF